MTIKELINKLLDSEMNLNSKVGISITRENYEGYDKVIYVGAEDSIEFLQEIGVLEKGTESTLWLNAHIRDNSKVIRREGTAQGE